MKNFILRLICLALAMAVALFAFGGCSTKPSDDDISSSVSSNELQSNTPETTDENGSSEEPVQSEDNWQDSTEDYFAEDYQEDEAPNGIFNDDGDELLLDEVNIKNSKPLVNTFMGNGAGVYCAYNFLEYFELDLPIKENYTAKEFERFQNMGIYQVRSKLDYRWLFNEDKQEWDFESKDAQAVYKWLDLAKEYNIEVMFNPWNFSWLEYLEKPAEQITNPDTMYLRTDSFEENSKRWCDVTAGFYKNLYARGYHNVKYLMVFTEPLNTNTTDDSAQHYVDNLKRLHTTLKNNGLREKIKIVGPNRIGGERDKFKIHQMIYSQCEYAVDIYSQHDYLAANNIADDTYSTYALKNWDETINYFKNDIGITKPVWIDEWNVRDMSLSTDGVGDNHAWTGVQQAVGVTFAMNGGYSNAVLWMLADQQWPVDFTDPTKGFNKGLMFHGLFQDIRITTVPKMQYYAYSLLSKYCGRENGKTYFCDNHYEEAGVYVSCVETASGDWTIIAVNTNFDDIKLDFNFEKSLGGKKLYRHQYIAGEAENYPNAKAYILPANKTIHNVTNGFSDILPGFGSVQVYTTIKG